MGLFADTIVQLVGRASAKYPSYDYVEDPLDRALAEIASLANNMNEGKCEAVSQRKPVQWQLMRRGALQRGGRRHPAILAIFFVKGRNLP
jgi:hypothetical protein